MRNLKNSTSILDVKKSKYIQVNNLFHIILQVSIRGYSRGLDSQTLSSITQPDMPDFFNTWKHIIYEYELHRKVLKIFSQTWEKRGFAAPLNLCFIYAQLDISTLSIFSQLVPKERSNTIITAVQFQQLQKDWQINEWSGIQAYRERAGSPTR